MGDFFSGLGSILSPIAGPLISGGANLLGGAIAQGNTASNNAQQEAFQNTEMMNQEAYNSSQVQQQENFQTQSVQNQEQYNTSQVQAQEAFQEQMSNTAYQRATADMKAAGINPVLAYSQGGASTPQGNSASASAPSGSSSSVSAPQGNTFTAPNLLGNAVSSALDTANTMSDINLKSAQASNTQSKTVGQGYENKIEEPMADLFTTIDDFLKGSLPKANSAASLAGNNFANTLDQTANYWSNGVLPRDN